MFSMCSKVDTVALIDLSLSLSLSLCDSEWLHVLVRKDNNC